MGCLPHLRKTPNRLSNASQQILNRRSKGGRFFSFLRFAGEAPTPLVKTLGHSKRSEQKRQRTAHPDPELPTRDIRGVWKAERVSSRRSWLLFTRDPFRKPRRGAMFIARHATRLIPFVFQRRGAGDFGSFHTRPRRAAEKQKRMCGDPLL